MKFRTISISRFTLLAVPCAALLVYVMATARRVHANVPGTNGRIAFIQGDPNGVGPTNIVTANPDGLQQNPLPLPPGIGADFFSAVVWSPDGRKLLISHTLRPGPGCVPNCLAFRPAIVNPDGSDFTLLTITYGPDSMECNVWSLDQNRLLCHFDENFDGKTVGVFSIRASDGGDPVQLTANPFASSGGFDLPTDISPDGTRFVFVRYKPGASPAPRPDQTQQVALFVANIDGTGLRQITPYGVAMPHDLAWASWSPDGLNIIFAMRNGRLFIAHPDGESLTPINLQTGAARYFAFHPHWAPDGTRIIFGISINGGEGIYTANPDGSDVKQVTFTMDFSAQFNAPDWGRQPIQ